MAPTSAHLNTDINYFRRLFILLACIALPFISSAQQTISSITVSTSAATSSTVNTTSPSDAGNNIVPSSSYNLLYGQGNDIFVASYTVASTTYDRFLRPDTLVLNRRLASDRLVNIWYTISGINTAPTPDEISIIPTPTTDADAIYQTGTLNAGYDNILVNDDDLAGGSIQVETERVDVIWYQGIQTSSPSTAVFPVIERGGNDNIAIAAITSLNVDGTPASYGTLVGIPETFWPGSGQSFNNYLILRRETAGVEPIPLLNIGTLAGQAAQVVQGVAVSFNTLGISANQSIYGYSLFSADVCTGFVSDTNDVLTTGAQTTKPGIDLTDITTFPSDTKSDDSGLDLVAGVSAAVSSDDNLIETKGPGGYKAALATWLKANDGAFVSSGGAASTEGSNVGFWEDQSVGNHDFTTLVTAPTFRSSTSSINFNPTVDFIENVERGLLLGDNEDYNLISGNPGYTRKSINVAFRTNPNDVTTRQQIYEEGGGSNGLGIYIDGGNIYGSVWNRGSNGTGSPWNNATPTSFVSGGITANTEYILTLEFDGSTTFNGQVRVYLNGASIGTLSGAGILFNHGDDIGLGDINGGSRYHNDTNAAASFDGEISEFIYCNEPGQILSAQRNRIESYLAIKYGITLDQSSPINYYNSDGDIIFNTTQAASLGGYLEYNNDIAGIGRDDASELDQPASRSENTGSVVTIDRGATISTNDTWLIWGNDGGALTESAALTMPAAIDNRLTRVWRVAEQNEVLTTSVSFDLTGLGLSTNPNDFSLLIAGNATNADFSNASVISGGTFNGNTITFTGVDLDDGEYFTLGTSFFQCSPGGIETNLTLWLRADEGTNTTVEGENVTSWEDQTQNSNDASGGGTSPSYLENNINFNPAIEFDGIDEVITGTAGFNTTAYYFVAKPDNDFTSASGVQVPVGFDVSSSGAGFNAGGFYFGGLYAANDVIGHIVGFNVDPRYVRAEIDATKTISQDIPLIFSVKDDSGGTITTFFQNGERVDNTDGFTFLSATNEEYEIGRPGNVNGNYFDGKIGEVISFSSRPSDDEHNKIETYLAIKYGITLSSDSDGDATLGEAIGSFTEGDYRSSDGTVIWDYSANTTYHNDVTGIGRDDLSCLAQKQSTSQNSNAIVTMGLGTVAATNAANPNNFDDDGDFLIWGNDADFADQANANTVDVPGNVTERMERIWKVQDTGNTGATTIQFDINGLGYSTNVSDFNLIISNSATMASGTVSPAASLVDGVLTFNNIDLTDGQFFTLGTARTSCGPGGITTDLQLWLRADAEVFNTGTTPATDGQTVNSWSDQSANAANATDPSNLATYEANTVNFNPAVEFAQDATSLEGTFTTTTAGLTMFTSAFYNSVSVNNDAIFEVNGPGGGSANRSFFADQRYGGTNIFSSTITEDAWNFWSIDHPSGSTANIFENGGTLVSSYNTSLSVAGTGTYEYTLGDDDTGGNDFTGFIGDLIVYQGTMTTTQRRQVETYLAIKYGITIDQSSATNYIWSDGSTVIWDATANSGYNQDIAGIGRDDASCFSQKQSSSVNSDDILTIGLGSVANSNAENINSFADDGDYLIWGNDGGATAQANAETTDVPATITERMTRIWRVDDTGAVGNTELQFDLTGLGYGTNAEDFALLVGNTATMADASIITGGTLNGSTLSFSGIDLTDGQYFTIATAFATCGPGGVNTNIALWLRADEDVFVDAGITPATDNNDVAQWNDQSSPQDNASVSTLGGAGPIEPTFQTNEANFNPVLRFTDPNSSNAAYMETSTNNVSGDFTLISVFSTGQNQGTANDFVNSPALIGASETSSTLDYGMGMENGTIWVNANTSVGFDAETSGTYNNNFFHIATATRAQTTGLINIYVDSESAATGVGSTSALTGPTSFGIGNHSDGDLDAQFAGDIAETIVFSSALTSDERNRVESYLALKYGLTRRGSDDMTTMAVDERDYRASDGGVIWDFDGQGATYYNDIFGIGKDDLSCFEQTKSKSENSDALVTFNLPGGFGSNDSFILSGNDNAPIENPDNEEFNSSQVSSRLNREWRVQETGNVGSIEVTFDLATISGPLGVGTNNLSLLRLMVDDDGDFTSGVTLISPSSFNGTTNTATFTVNFNDGQYYTLGSEENAALPIELISFDANVLENKTVRLNWATASEENNAFFTVERSADGQSFEAISFIDGAGISNQVQYYQYLDKQPLEGYSFYRLKQTDYSGEFDYSEVRSVFVERLNQAEYVLYPNPIDQGDEVQIRYRVSQDKTVSLQVYDLNGKALYYEEKDLFVNGEVIRIPTSGLSRGLHIVKITDAQNRTVSFKLIVR